jgi:putative glutamine amidotransferase
MDQKKKKFGISLRVELIEKYNERRDTISQEWTNFLQKLAITPILIPNTLDDVKSYISDVGIDGIILSGGDNTGKFPERDQTEKQILDYAIDKRFPILGVCRGMQIINEYFGGKVLVNDNNNHVGKSHQINIMDQKFSKLLGDNNIEVNSFHNNIIAKKSIGEKLRIFALSPDDNTIEGYYHSELPIIGVMWHPERGMVSKHQTRLMEIFENKSLW